MWKKLALVSLIAAARTAGAQDMGTGVSFGVARMTFEAGPQGGPVVFETAESQAIAETWDTVLIQGVSPEPQVAFEFARRDAAGAWSAWTQGTLKRSTKGRFWARAKFAAAAPGTLRLRGVGTTTLSAKPVQIYSVEVFDSRAGDGDEAPVVPPAKLPLERPAVVSREEWGAAPATEAYTEHAPARLTLHHTAGSRPATLAEGKEEARFVQDFHQNGRGWIDVGYHFLIDAAGNIYAGRPEGVVGAHVKGANTSNVGISLMGNHHPPQNDELSAESFESAAALGKALVALYGLDASTLLGHRDFGSGTACPGDIAHARLAELRDRLKPVVPPPGPLAGLLRLPLAASTPRWD